MHSEIKYVDHGVDYIGTYRIDGRMLDLTCCYGRRRAVIGLFDEKVLARRLLKFLVAKAGREVASHAPHPATIGAAKTKAPTSIPAQPRKT